MLLGYRNCARSLLMECWESSLTRSVSRFSDRRTNVVCSSREVSLELSAMSSQVAFTTAKGVESGVFDSEMVEAIPVQLAATDSSTRVNDGL
ncbi:hypothetical protein V6N12_012978 [Hibiscus sabdariffa]|uniref:Uncharacterized protein n=1 Tax=Hibiscus sabdariffa TaxID=183260 RepID=A0ABR2EGE1_9ROSI